MLKQLRLTVCVWQVDIFSMDVVIFPINIGNAHWTAAAINFARKRFEYYDSMGDCTNSASRVFKASPTRIILSYKLMTSHRICVIILKRSIRIRSPSRSTSRIGARCSILLVYLLRVTPPS